MHGLQHALRPVIGRGGCFRCSGRRIVQMERAFGDLRPAVAAHEPAVAHRLQRRLLNGAARLGCGAARGEDAAGRALAQRRRCTLDGWQARIAVAQEARHAGEQSDGIGVQRLRVERLDRPAGHHLAPVQHRHAVAQLRHQPEIVRHVQRSGACFADERAHQIEDGRLRGDVQRSRRFVEDQQPWPGDQRHGDAHALLHATAELMRIAPGDGGSIGDPDVLEHGDGLPAALRRGDPVVQAHDLGDLLADAHGRVERIQRILRDQADRLAPQLAQRVRVGGHEVLAAEQDAPAADARIRGEEAHQRQRQGAFAAAAFADEAVDFAGRNLQRDIAQHARPARGEAILDRERLRGDHRRGVHSSCPSR